MQQDEALKKMVEEINEEVKKYLNNNEVFKPYTQTMKEIDEWLKEKKDADNK